jgi:hypothetical protein
MVKHATHVPSNTNYHSRTLGDHSVDIQRNRANHELRTFAPRMSSDSKLALAPLASVLWLMQVCSGLGCPHEMHGNSWRVRRCLSPLHMIGGLWECDASHPTRVAFRNAQGVSRESWPLEREREWMGGQDEGTHTGGSFASMGQSNSSMLD